MMVDNKYLIFLLTLILSMGLNSPQAEEKIKLGVSTALTSDASTWGNDIKNTLIFANKKLTNNKYELIFEDDRCNGKDAVNIAHKFINVHKIKYTIGFACSSTILSAARLYERSKILSMVVSASASEIKNSGDYIFRTWASDAGAAKKLYDFISSKHKKIGVISEQSDYSQSFFDAFSKINIENKLNIVNYNYLTSTTDFRSIFLKLKAKNIEAIFLNTQTEASFITALKQLRELKLNIPVYNAYWAGTSTVISRAKNLVNNVYYVDLPGINDALNKEGIKLYKEYKKEYGVMQSTDLLFATTIEGFRALHLAIESNKDPKTFLYETKFNGIFGNWHFDQDGEIQGLDFVIKKVENGVPKIVN